MIVIYTSSLPAGVAGEARGPFIFIRPEYKDDIGLHIHEYVHVWQWVISGLLATCVLSVAALGLEWPSLLVASPIGLLVHPLAHRFSKSYRLWAEVIAYRQQMRFPDRNGHKLSLAAAALRLTSVRYGLGISFHNALQVLAGEDH